MITRLDDRLAGLQTTWSIVVHRRCSSPRSCVVQRAPDLARYRWSFLLVGVVLLLLPLVPGPRLQRRRGQDLGQPRPDQLPARRVRQAAAGHLLRRLPRREPRADRREHVARRAAAPARAPPPAADPAGLGLHRRRDGRRARPRLVAAVLRPVRRDDVGRHRARQLPRDRVRAVRRRGVRGVADVRPRPGPRHDLARPVVRPPRQAATRSCRRCTACPTAASAAPGSASAARTPCPRRRTTSSSRRSARSSACSARRPC